MYKISIIKYIIDVIGFKDIKIWQYVYQMIDLSKFLTL